MLVQKGKFISTSVHNLFCQRIKLENSCCIIISILLRSMFVVNYTVVDRFDLGYIIFLSLSIEIVKEFGNLLKNVFLKFVRILVFFF